MSLSVVKAYLTLDQSALVEVFNSIQLSECINQTIMVSVLSRFLPVMQRIWIF